MCLNLRIDKIVNVTLLVNYECRYIHTVTMHHHDFITFQRLLRLEGCVCSSQAAGGVPQEVRKGGGHRTH